MSVGRSCRPLPKGTGAGIRQFARHATIWTGHTHLPADVVEKAVRRLGILGLLSAAAHVALHFANRFVLPSEVFQRATSSSAYGAALVVAVTCGFAVYALANRGKLRPGLMLDFGLIFEVVGALCIGLIESSRYGIGGGIDPGPKGIALWITLFVLVVPNTLGKTSLAAVAAASMGPIALVTVTYVDRLPPPPAHLFLVGAIPNFIVAAIAITLSRFVYALGADVSKARELGSYKLVERLGRGAMGEVWRAQHRLLARPAAIKLIQPEVLGCTDAKGTAILRRRFEKEAQATAMLSSPHTIDLYDFGMSEDGAFYYVMELLHGVDLETLIDRYGPVPADRVASFVVQVCASLEEAHHDGLIHRDIKPANIYTCRYGLEYDFVKVLDFGVVKSREDTPGQTRLTRADDAAGTPGFMAPEVAIGAAIDQRVDIYAVGCLAYWLLTGRLVFEEETSFATMMAHAQKRPIPPSQRTEIEILPAFEALVLKCLEKEPGNRPSSAAEIRRSIVQTGLASSWTAERAEKWWKAHMPELVIAGTQSDNSRGVLQSHAQAI